MSKLYLQHDYRVTGKDYVETDGGDFPTGGTYSEEEHIVGAWLDGSPIYERTQHITRDTPLPHNSETVLPNFFEDTTGIQILDYEVIGLYGSDNLFIRFDLDLNPSGSGNVAISSSVYPNYIKVWVGADFSAQNTISELYVTVKYLRTE